MMFYSLIFLVLNVGIVSHAFAETPQNAHDFIAALAEDEGGSGGGGNGGGDLHFKLFKTLRAGLVLMGLERIYTNEMIAQVAANASKTRVFFVTFKLCNDPKDSTCDDSVALTGQNFPEVNVLLINAAKYEASSVLRQRQVIVHEFSALSNLKIERSNAFFTSVASEVENDELLSSEQTFRDYEKIHSLKEYFQNLNDLYFLLLGAPPKVFDGTWKKVAAVRPGKMQYTNDPQKLLEGSYAYQFEVTEQDGDFLVHVNDVSKKMMEYSLKGSENSAPGGGPISVIPISLIYGCLDGSIRDGELKCVHNANVFNSGINALYWGQLATKKFLPSWPIEEAKEQVEMPFFSCKALSDNNLICRHVYWKQIVSPSVPGSFGYRVSEYGFYVRAGLKVAHPITQKQIKGWKRHAQ